MRRLGEGMGVGGEEEMSIGIGRAGGVVVLVANAAWGVRGGRWNIWCAGGGVMGGNVLVSGGSSWWEKRFGLLVGVVV